MANIVFFGSSWFSEYFLRELKEQDKNKIIDVKGIVTNPDALIGRNKVLKENIVKKYAILNNIPFVDDIGKAGDFVKGIDPDVCFVASFGKIIKKDLLEIPRFGFINVHGSILPSLRGAVPIQMAILKGLKKTGVTIFKMKEGLDDGPIIALKEVEIEENDNFETLGRKIAREGAKVFLENIELYLKGQIYLKEQEHNKATFCYIRDLNALRNLNLKENSAFKIERVYRALSPFEFISLNIGKENIILIDVKAVNIERKEDFFIDKIDGQKALYLKTSEGYLKLNKVKPVGKKEMSGVDFWNGYLRKVDA